MESRTYETARKYQVQVPELGSAEWNELTARLFHRPDMRPGFWPVDMVVGALISEYPNGGGFTVEDYDAENHATTDRVLAVVRWVPGTELTEVKGEGQ